MIDPLPQPEVWVIIFETLEDWIIHLKKAPMFFWKMVIVQFWKWVKMTSCSGKNLVKITDGSGKNDAKCM